MELICTRCDGLGQERWMKRNMVPQSNVAGWYRGPVNSTGWDCDYYWRPCEACNGEGFRPSGTSVPTFPVKDTFSPDDRESGSSHEPR